MATEVERSLIAELRAHPDDWQRWLVYADWLAEHDAPRGEIITLEHRLAVATLSADERRALQQRSHALEIAEQATWRASGALPAGAKAKWWRGSLIGVWLPWNGDTLAELARLLAHPDAGLLFELDLSENRVDFQGREEKFLAEVLGGRYEPMIAEPHPGSTAVVRVIGGP